MNIFFAGSIRGGREHQPLYQECVALLKEYGTVLTEHLAEDTLTRHGESEMDEQSIFEKEISNIQKADILIADVTVPSLGVGYLISYAENIGKRIVCMYNGNPVNKLSAMIQGNKKLEINQYQTVDDLKNIIDKIFKE